MSKNKQLVFALFTLFITVLALSTAVFAWFTINVKSEANGFFGSAKSADGGFYLKLDDGPWESEVDLSGITPQGFAFEDLTTENGRKLVDFSSLEVEDGYIEFDLEFLTGSLYKYIYLTGLDITSPESTSWISEATVGGVILGEEMKARFSDAIRVSITNSSNETKIFEKGAGANELGEFPNTTGFGGFALSYYNTVMDASLSVPINITNRGDIALGANGSTLTYLSTSSDTNTPSHNLDESYTHYEKMTIRIWFEGWDGEAFNAVANGVVEIDFKFQVYESMQ